MTRPEDRTRTVKGGTDIGGSWTSVESEDARRHRRVALGCGLSSIGALGAFVTVLVLLASSVHSCSLQGLRFGGVRRDTGSNSRHLPVEVTPHAGLADGATVFVTTSALPRTITEAAVDTCLSEADTQRRGIAACDTTVTSWFEVKAGRLTAGYRVHRVITVDGVGYDCATRAGRCVIVAASRADYDESGGMPITFAPAPPVSLIARTVRPETLRLPGALSATNGPAGTSVTVTARGYVPGEPLLVAVCTPGYDTFGLVTCADSPAIGDALGGVFTLGLATTDFSRWPLRATRAGTVDTTATLRASIKPAASIAAGDHAPVACSRPGRCIIVVAAVADPQRSTLLPFTATP